MDLARRKDERFQRWRQDYRRTKERLEAATTELEKARPAFQKALVDVEIFGSEPIRQAARAWAKDIDERYEWLFRGGEYVPEEVRDLREGELRQHRDPFLELIRQELRIEF